MVSIFKQVYLLLCMTEISNRLHITKSAVTSLADKLEKTKLIKRTPHATDRRFYLLQLLPRGEKMLHVIQTEMVDILMDNLRSFTVDERKVISSFYQNLDKQLEKIFAAHEKK